MFQLLGSMARLPVVVFVSTMEIAIRMMREMQHGLAKGIEVVTGGAGPVLDETLHTAEALAGGPKLDTTTEKEKPKMVDQDFGGDDLKIVRVRVLYTKRDYEELLLDKDFLLNYRTTGADFGGKIFNQEVAAVHPELLAGKDPDFLQTFVEVVARYPKQDKTYDKDQVAVLREIANRI